MASFKPKPAFTCNTQSDHNFHTKITAWNRLPLSFDRYNAARMEQVVSRVAKYETSTNLFENLHDDSWSLRQIYKNILIYPSLHHISHFGCMIVYELIFVGLLDFENSAPPLKQILRA